MRYKFVKDQSIFSACGALLELVLKKKNPACGGLGLSPIYFEKKFPACGGLGISPTLLILVRIEWSLKKKIPPAGGSEFPACGGLLNFSLDRIELKFEKNFPACGGHLKFEKKSPACGGLFKFNFTTIL